MDQRSGLFSNSDRKKSEILKFGSARAVQTRDQLCGGDNYGQN